MTRLPTDKHKVEDHLPLELTESDLERATGGGSGGGAGKVMHDLLIEKHVDVASPKFF
jgi:type VI protein secretion system component Hcp